MKVDTIIFDGSHAAHRISAATPPLNNTKGERTEVIYGLLRLLSSVMRANPSSRCYVVWDGPGCKQIRRDVYPDYKVHRDKKDDGTKERLEAMHEQLNRFWEQFGQYLPIHWVTSRKYEADDLIAMLANESVKSGDKVLIVSGDNDLLQLVTRQVVVYSPFRNAYCELENFAQYTNGFPHPQAWLYAKCLMGDSSDNIKGIGGVAEKTALKILQGVNWDIEPLKYGHAPNLEGKLAAKVKDPATWPIIAQNYKLMSLSAKAHQGFAQNKAEEREGNLNNRQLQMNCARNQFASIIGGFTQWIGPFKLLER